MCRTVHALLQVAICGVQMLVRVFMTIILMIENLIRMILQTLYNFISFMMQIISLIPICVVFLLTARMKCFMCGGGGPCPVNRGGACDCLMSAMAIVILLLIFRATGVLDKIFYKLGYVKARPLAFTRFVPTPGEITECSRNSSEYDDTDVPTTTPLTGTITITTPITTTTKTTTSVRTTKPTTTRTTTPAPTTVKLIERAAITSTLENLRYFPTPTYTEYKEYPATFNSPLMDTKNDWTTVVYYLV